MVVPRIGRTRLGHRTLKCALTIGTQSAQSIRASGTSAASTGRTRDRARPMLQQRQKVLAKAPSTRDPKRTLVGPPTMGPHPSPVDRLRIGRKALPGSGSLIEGNHLLHDKGKTVLHGKMAGL